MCKRVGGVVASSFIGAVLAQDVQWVSELQRQGYLVNEGLYAPFTSDTCLNSDTCYALNPATPYGMLYFPPHANETTDGNYTNTWCQHKMCQVHKGETYAASWRVAPGEAIVMVGRTPPKSTYWSITPYMYSRFNEAGFRPHPERLHDSLVACPRGPARCEVFSGVNDPINFQTVNTSSGSPFSADIAIVLSWDSEAQAAVTKQLEAAKVGPVNQLQFPGAVGKLGVTTGHEDEYMGLVRVEGIKSKAEADAYYSSTPYRVFRVSPPLDKPPAASSAHPSFEGHMRTRWTGRNESTANVSNKQLRDGLQKLRDAVIRQHPRIRDHKVLEFESFVNDSGYECLAQGLKCQGDCRDTIYAKQALIPQEIACNATGFPCKPSMNSELTEAKDDAYYVIGVNHKMTGQSLYSSMTFYNFPKLSAGLLQLPDGRAKASVMDEDYRGSAENVLPDHAAAPYLYAIKYSRTCSKSEKFFCVVVPTTTSDPLQTPLSVTDEFVFIERMYIHPGTKSGPAVSETVMPVLIHVRPEHQKEIMV